MKSIPAMMVCMVLASPAMAAVAENEAVTIALSTIAKKKATPLPPECLTLVTQDDGWTFGVYEKHNATCGGDPATAPYLFELSVDRKTGAARIIRD